MLYNMFIVVLAAIICIKMKCRTCLYSQVITPLLRCLGNVCSGPDDACLQAWTNPGLLQAFQSYLSSPHRHIRKETLWVLSNITGKLYSLSRIVHHTVQLLYYQIVSTLLPIGECFQYVTTTEYPATFRTYGGLVKWGGGAI